MIPPFTNSPGRWPPYDGSSSAHNRCRGLSLPWSSRQRAMLDFKRISSASIVCAAHDRTPCHRGRIQSSGLPGLIAEEDHDNRGPFDVPACCPSKQSRQESTRRSCDLVDFDQETPARDSRGSTNTPASLTCQIPPMPTKWIGPTSVGKLRGCVHRFLSFGARAFHHLGEFLLRRLVWQT